MFIEDNARQAAQDVALSATRSGYRFDFRPHSIHEVERLIREWGTNVTFTLGAPRDGMAVFALGSYVGEVIRRDRGGRWTGDDDDPDAELNVAVRLRDGSTIWPVQRAIKRAIKRMEHGSEDSIVAYAVGLDVAVGDPPAPPTRLTKLIAAARHDPSPSALRAFRRWRDER